MTFKNQKTKVNLENYHFSISSLTTSNHYGQGLKLLLKYDPINISSYYDQLENLQAGSVTYSFDNNHDLQINYIKNEQQLDNQIWSVKFTGSLLQEQKIELEYAWRQQENSAVSNAWKSELTGEYKEIEYRIHFMQANSNYPGKIENSFYRSLKLKCPLNNTMKISPN